MFPKNLVAHYTTLSTLIENILPTRQIRLSSLRQLNDPKESKERSAITYQGLDLDWKGGDLLEEYQRQMDSFIKVLCLSSNSNDAEIGIDRMSYALPNMWAHYGGNHRGAALLFDPKKLIDQIDSKSLSLKEAKPVIYDRYNHHNDEVSSFGVLDNEDIVGLVKENIDKHLIPSLYIKDLSWSTEQEFRFTVYDRSGDQYAFIDFGDSLSGIVIGNDFPFEYLPSLRQLLPKDTLVCQYCLSSYHGGYELENIDIDKYRYS